jgi:hypothetical protein
VIHVDDLLHTCTDYKLRDNLHEALNKAYQEIKVQSMGHNDNKSLSYLGIDLRHDPINQSLILSTPHYDEDLLQKMGDIRGTATNQQATDDLFEIDETSPSIDPNEFASHLMRVMYLAK